MSARSRMVWKIRVAGLFAFARLLTAGCGDEWGEWVYDEFDSVKNVWIKKCDTSSKECECTASEGTRLGCAYITIDTGPMPPGSPLPSGLLRVQASDPTPALSTPQVLRWVAGYGIHSVSAEKTPGGVPRTVYVIDPDATMIQFRFDDGAAVGVPVAAQSTDEARMMMVDAEGWAVTNEPAYYDLYPGNGDLYRFSASTNAPDYLQLILHRTASGREDRNPVEVIRDENGVIRQIMAASRLVDIVPENAYKYTVRSYAVTDVESGKNPDGYYVPKTNAEPFKTWIIENPDTNTINRLRVIEIVGSSSNVSDFVYSEGAHEWELTKGDGLRVETESTIGGGPDMPITTVNTVRDDQGNIVRRKRVYFEMYPWGPSRTEEVEDPDGLALTTEYAYYQDPAETGRYSNLKYVKFPDGSWKWYDYNDEGCKILEISPWKDAPFGSSADQARAIYYDYTPLDTNDTLIFNDRRPRTVTEKILGITVAKTFYVYKYIAGRLVEVKEECVDPAASYGDADNLRTITTYYGSNDPAAAVGFVKSIIYPDGRQDTYAYEYGEYVASPNPADCHFEAHPDGSAFRTTITHGTTNSPNGIAYKTTKEVTVQDELGNEVLTETYVYTGGTNYERIFWTVKEFDVFGNAVQTYRSNGEHEEASWGPGCCGKENETDAYGIERVFEYDALGRLAAETKIGTNSPDDDLRTSYTYDAADRLLTKTLSGGGLSLSTSNAYDGAGRIVQSQDQAGLITTYAYSIGSKRVTKTLPGGATEITERYLDGQLKSVTGTAVVPRYYEYGVNADGTQWTIVYTGPDGTNSPMWQKTTTDMLGRTIKVEKPGFGGSVLTNAYVYDSKGHLIRSTRHSAPDTLYAYDQMGNQIRSGLDVNDNGSLDLASMDRITETETSYRKEDGDWWAVTCSKIYPAGNDPTPVTTAVRKVRLTGLPIADVVSETISIDIHGNETIARTAIDRANKIVTETIKYPDSTQAVVTVKVNGLLRSSVSKTGVQTTYGYDGLERLCSSRSISGYSGERLVSTITHYNDKGQIDYSEDAQGNRTEFSYDADTGRRIAVRDALSNVTYTAYSPRGKVTHQWGAVYPVRYIYDGFGRLSGMYTYRNGTNWDSATWPTNDTGAGDVTRWHYDEATGLLTNKEYADGQGPSYEYDSAGRLIRRTWARGITVQYSYDRLGQLTNVNYSDSTRDVSITYDRLGRPVTIRDGAGSRVFSYDGLLRVTNETLAASISNASYTLARSYDALGRASGFCLIGPNSNSVQSVTYAYDSAGRFFRLGSDLGSLAFEYCYLPGSDLLAGYTETSSGFRVTYFYEGNRDLRTQVVNEYGTNLISRYTYDYDPVGRRIQRTDDVPSSPLPCATNIFGYNTRSELISAEMATNSFAYQYDHIGNRELARINADTNWYMANNLNQYTLIFNLESTNQLSYDPDGNLTNDGIWAYTWNGENRLIAVTPILPDTNSPKLEFTYDYMGRRVGKKVYEWDPATSNYELSTEHVFLYDGWNLIEERITDYTSQPITRSTNQYVWGLDLSGTLQGAGGIGGLLGSTSSSSSNPSFLYCYDVNGNVVQLLESTNGDLAAEYEYDPYGNLVAEAGIRSTNDPFHFSTKYTDPETGHTYYGYRFYAPRVGRWLSRDPIEERGGLSLYAYVRNDPVSDTDPLGNARGGFSIIIWPPAWWPQPTWVPGWTPWVPRRLPCWCPIPPKPRTPGDWKLVWGVGLCPAYSYYSYVRPPLVKHLVSLRLCCRRYWVRGDSEHPRMSVRPPGLWGPRRRLSPRAGMNECSHCQRYCATTNVIIIIINGQEKVCRLTGEELICVAIGKKMKKCSYVCRVPTIDTVSNPTGRHPVGNRVVRTVRKSILISPDAKCPRWTTYP